jgi:hypothetical protein
MNAPAYRPEPPKPAERQRKRDCVHRFFSKRKATNEAIAKLVRRHANLIEWKPSNHEQFLQAHRAIKNTLKHVDPSLSFQETGNMTLLGVMNVAIAGGHRPVVQKFIEQHHGYADYNPYGNTAVSTSSIDQNNEHQLLGSSAGMYRIAQRMLDYSPLETGESIERKLATGDETKTILQKLDPNGSLMKAMPARYRITDKHFHLMENPQEATHRRHTI